MIRTAVSLISSVIFFMVQVAIVANMKGYEVLYFDNYTLTISVLAMNFFLSFTILSHIKQWYETVQEQTSSQF
ncbi:hypothetical protein RZN25_16750 [Bacillaceae bacterium S4-13-56]